MCFSFKYMSLRQGHTTETTYADGQINTEKSYNELHSFIYILNRILQ